MCLQLGNLEVGWEQSWGLWNGKNINSFSLWNSASLVNKEGRAWHIISLSFHVQQKHNGVRQIRSLSSLLCTCVCIINSWTIHVHIITYWVIIYEPLMYFYCESYRIQKENANGSSILTMYIKCKTMIPTDFCTNTELEIY